MSIPEGIQQQIVEQGTSAYPVFDINPPADRLAIELAPDIRTIYSDLGSVDTADFDIRAMARQVRELTANLPKLPQERVIAEPLIITAASLIADGPETTVTYGSNRDSNVLVIEDYLARTAARLEEAANTNELNFQPGLTYQIITDRGSNDGLPAQTDTHQLTVKGTRVEWRGIYVPTKFDRTDDGLIINVEPRFIPVIVPSGQYVHVTEIMSGGESSIDNISSQVIQDGRFATSNTGATQNIPTLIADKAWQVASGNQINSWERRRSRR